MWEEEHQKWKKYPSPRSCWIIWFTGNWLSSAYAFSGVPPITRDIWAPKIPIKQQQGLCRKCDIPAALWSHCPFSQSHQSHTCVKCIFKAFPTNFLQDSPLTTCLLLHSNKHIHIWKKGTKNSSCTMVREFCPSRHRDQTAQILW